MSQDFMDPEIFADFIVEAKEHLETIEPTLLELEKTPDNLSLLNDVFRPMHSLKGASGFLGLNRINGLAHKSENVLEELRTGRLSVNTEIMDVILSSTDALRTMIDNLETQGSEGEVETEHIIEELAAILKGEGVASGAASPEAQSVEAEPAAAEPAEESAQDAADKALAAMESGGAEASGAGEEPEDASEAIAEEEPEEALPPFEPETYKLTAIGEDHLADFLEEAGEIVENLNSALVTLEKDPAGNDDVVNDTFRYFHNLKGNSGIIGYKELNSLTHEAETLLNKVRKGEMEASQSMIDLLLAAVDLIDDCIGTIDASSGMVTTIDTRLTVARLKQAVEGGEIKPPVKREDLGKPTEADADEAAAKSAPQDAPAAEDSVVVDDQEYDPEDVQIFEQTNSQQVDNIRLALDTLREDPDNSDYVDGLYRSLTTVQNSAGYMGFDEIKDYAERTAGLVDQGRKSDVGFDIMLDILEQECSILTEMLKKKLATLEDAMGSAGVAPIEAESDVAKQPESEPKAESEPEPAPESKPEPKPEPKPESKPESKPETKPEPKPVPKAKPKPQAKPQAKAAQPQAQAKPKTSSTIRVDHEKLDHLMNLIGELIINRNRFSMLAKALEEGNQDVQEVAQSLVETTDSMNRISDDLQDTIMNVRMVPVGTVFSRFPRLVRDLSRKSGKQVELIMEGEDTELDKSVVEVIGDPLVHMIRNSVDHGLESQEVRDKAGKDAMGHVWLRAYHKGNSVAIEVEDDGKGIDPDKMREKAVEKGVITQEQAAQMDDREATELIFAPGFSSAEEVTDISGRGVGMDVVRSNIKNLKGSVNVTSEPGKGTKITLNLPLTLAIIDALMVTVSGETFAIPLDAVSETTKIEARRLTDVNKRKALELRGEVLGIIQLSELLELPDNTEQREMLPLVIIQDNDRRLGVVVDRLLERQEIVIKPLGAYLSDFDIKGMSGATIMGDGSVVLILDPHEVYMMASASTRGI